MSTSGGAERIRGPSRDALSDANELLKASDRLTAALKDHGRDPAKSRVLVKEAEVIFRQVSDSRGGDEALDALARSASSAAVIINMGSLARNLSPDAADRALRKLIIETAKQTRSTTEVAAVEKITEVLSTDTLIDEAVRAVREGNDLPKSA